MLNEKLTELINQQINAELYSAYLYMDFAEYFDHNDLKGFGHWFHVQAKEEIEHAQKFCDYMIDQGRKPELGALDAPKAKITNALSVAKSSLAHEVLITSMIDKIYEVAVETKDYRTQQFLAWFITEQAEEENNACDMVALLDRVEGNKAALYFADKEMGKR